MIFNKDVKMMKWKKNIVLRKVGFHMQTGEAEPLPDRKNNSKWIRGLNTEAMTITEK